MFLFSIETENASHDNKHKSLPNKELILVFDRLIKHSVESI